MFLIILSDFETIPLKIQTDMRKVDPESAALIFPFLNPVQYYENKKHKQVKGHLVKYLPNPFNPQLF